MSVITKWTFFFNGVGINFFFFSFSEKCMHMCELVPNGPKRIQLLFPIAFDGRTQIFASTTLDQKYCKIHGTSNLMGPIKLLDTHTDSSLITTFFFFFFLIINKSKRKFTYHSIANKKRLSQSAMFSSFSQLPIFSNVRWYMNK